MREVDNESRAKHQAGPPQCDEKKKGAAREGKSASDILRNHGPGLGSSAMWWCLIHEKASECGQEMDSFVVFVFCEGRDGVDGWLGPSAWLLGWVVRGGWHGRQEVGPEGG